MYKIIINEFFLLKNQEKSKVLMNFFKTKKNEYGEGDEFLGITIPQIREKVKQYHNNIDFDIIDKLVKNKYHEIRMFALLFIVYKSEKEKNIDVLKKYVDFCIENVDYINNWDLVDLSVKDIIGKYCFLIQNNDIIYNYANKIYNKNNKKLTNLWCERISLLSSFYFIKNNQFDLTIDLCNNFLNSKEDLIQKACGWMLREIGKRDLNILFNFLDKNYKIMPRTMLRYSIEKLDNDKRKFYLTK